MNKFVSLVQSRRARMAAVTVASAAATGSAMADLPAGVATMFTQVGSDFTAIAALGFTLLATCLGGYIVFKIVKKVANKAT